MPLKNEWLKTIVGDAFTEEMDKAVAKHLGENFVSRSDFNEKVKAVTTLEATVKERDKQLETLQALKPEEMQATIKTLQNENKVAAAEFKKQLDQAKLSLGVEAAIAAAGAHKASAVRAMLDESKLKLNDDGTISGLSDQISALQKSEKWAFKSTTQQSPARTHQPGGTPPMEGTGEAGHNRTMNSFIRGTSINSNIGDE